MCLMLRERERESERGSFQLDTLELQKPQIIDLQVLGASLANLWLT